MQSSNRNNNDVPNFRGNCCFALCSPTTASSAATSSASSSMSVNYNFTSTRSPMRKSDGGGSLPKTMGGTTATTGNQKNKTRKKPLASMEADPDAVDTLIARELNQMSLEEREAAYEDVHGVRTQLDIARTKGGHDDPEANLDALIEDVKREISKIRVKTAYDKAVFMCPSFVNNRKFFVMFLRAEDYNVRDTANRIVMHFKCKLDLFGIEKLVKKITLEDLGQGELDVIASGCLQMSPQVKDMSGRTLAVAIQELFEFKDCMHQIRILWYLSMICVEEDEEAQLNGFVLVRFSVGSNTFDHDHLEYVRKCKALTQALPMKVRGFHFCYDDERLRPIMSAIQLILGRQRRVRFRAHFGSRVECLYSLMGFGIRMEAMPFDTSGRVIDGWYENFIQSRMQIESRLQIVPHPYKILYPRPIDVLLGRGRPYQDFPGNLFLAALVDEHRDSYIDSSKGDKTQMSNDMVNVIRNHGGRFLKKDDDPMYDGYWVEVMDEKLIREKVSHAFRTVTKRSKSASAGSNSSSGVRDNIGISGNIAASTKKALSLAFSKFIDEDHGTSGHVDHIDELESSLTRKKARMA